MTAARFSLVYGAYFLTIGLMLPFWPVWLEHRGFDAAAIGLVMALPLWLKVLTNPLVAGIADGLGMTRPIVVGLGALACAGFAGLSAIGSPLAIPLLYAGVMAALSAALPMVEVAALRADRARHIDYGQVRLWGSITFIAATVGAGWWLDGRSPEWIVWLATAAALIFAVTGIVMPDRRTERNRKGVFSGARHLLAQGTFWVFLLATGLSQTSHAVYYAFGTLHWQSEGLSESFIGALWAIGVVAEIILFAVIGRLGERIGPVGLLAIGCLGGVIRWPLTAVTVDPAALIALQILHAATFGATHLAAMRFLERFVPDRFAASGQALYAAAIGGVLFGAMMPMSGVLYGTFGAGAYAVMGLVCALALGLTGVLATMLRRAAAQTSLG